MCERNKEKVKQMNDKGLEQWAWECDIKEDISKLIKFANRIHAEAFSTGYDAGVAYQQEVNLKIINRIINELKGKL
jgi:G:T-mismatch repair DNA endonuclease (very short patch repair protein)